MSFGTWRPRPVRPLGQGWSHELRDDRSEEEKAAEERPRRRPVGFARWPEEEDHDALR